jgi:hypothetical protein
MNSQSRTSVNQEGNERLAFTLYHILREFDPNKQGYLTKTRFNKIAYLIHKDIEQNHDLNTGLPWYWYLFGSVVALEFCPQEVYVKEEIRRGDWRLYYGKEPKTGHLPSDQQSQILERVRYWHDKYLKTEEAIERAYSDVDIPFFGEIKDFSDYIGRAGKEPSESISLRLDRVMATYPEEQLRDLTSTYLRLDNMLRLIARAEPTKVCQFSSIVEDFRKLTLLRLGVVVSENMPEAWILRQSDEFARDLERFRTEFVELERKVFLEMREEKDKTGYAKRLMEISWEMYSEG